MLAMKSSRSRLVSVVLGVFFLTAVALPLPESADEPEPLSRFEFSEAHMGTLFRIVLYAPDAATADKASSAAFARIQELDHIMSDYRPSSELSRLSGQAGGPPIKISRDLFRVLSASEELSRRSDGAFDVTVGPVVLLWRRARRRHELPDRNRLARARELVGYQNLRLNPEAHTAQLLKPGMRLDLGGIAKGDAADQALTVLKGFGITRALVAAAGDIALGGPPPNEAGWRIGIEAFESPSSPPQRTISLSNAGVSTSGDSEQHLDISGVRYSHIIDPKTAVALTGHRSVTVVAPHDITADCYATALSVLGPRRGQTLVRDTPGTSMFMMVERGQQVRTFTSPGFPAMALGTPGTGPDSH